MTHIPSAALKPSFGPFLTKPKAVSPMPSKLSGSMPNYRPTTKSGNRDRIPVFRFLLFYLLGLSFSICKMGSRSQFCLDSGL